MTQPKADGPDIAALEELFKEWQADRLPDAPWPLVMYPWFSLWGRLEVAAVNALPGLLRLLREGEVARSAFNAWVQRRPFSVRKAIGDDPVAAFLAWEDRTDTFIASLQSRSDTAESRAAALEAETAGLKKVVDALAEKLYRTIRGTAIVDEVHAIVRQHLAPAKDAGGQRGQPSAEWLHPLEACEKCGGFRSFRHACGVAAPPPSPEKPIAPAPAPSPETAMLREALEMHKRDHEEATRAATKAIADLKQAKRNIDEAALASQEWCRLATARREALRRVLGLLYSGGDDRETPGVSGVCNCCEEVAHLGDAGWWICVHLSGCVVAAAERAALSPEKPAVQPETALGECDGNEGVPHGRRSKCVNWRALPPGGGK